MPWTKAPDDLSGSSLPELLGRIEKQKLRSVESWDPPHCGPSGMRIARDGSWTHDGSEIRRPEMVRLFASVLRREADGSFALVTPVEKLGIEVEDTPFLAVEVHSTGSGTARDLVFRLNTGELVAAGAGHDLRVEGETDKPRPLLDVRSGLEARIARPVFYELAEIALAEDADPPGLWSRGRFFPFLARP